MGCGVSVYERVKHGFGLKGKVAVVGGASAGLGRACAEVLAQEGCNLVMCSRTQSTLENTAKEIRANTDVEILTYVGDLDRNETIIGLVKTTVSHFGYIVLVNNSGDPPHGNAET